MAKDRRSFLKTAGMAAAVTSAAPLALSFQGVVPAGVPAVNAAPNPRTATTGRFALELEGTIAGFLQSYSGGFPFGTVLEFDAGNGSPVNKFIDGVRYDDITIGVGAGMMSAVWDWVEGMMGGAPVRKSGAIIFADHNYEAHSRLEFHDAWISEVSFPSLDAASKEDVVLTIVIAPETTELKAASGKVNAAATKQKKWLSSNFRLSVPDLPTARVNKVDGFVVKQQILEARDGTTRIPVRVPGKLEYPNLAFTLSQIDAAPWFDYFEQFVLLGTLETEKEGTLELLAPDLASVLWAVTFHNLGIFKCAFEKAEGASDNPAKIAVEMYMEGMALEVAG